jgi:hypothetical protein
LNSRRPSKESGKELPGLNHLFQKASTGAPSEYAKINETINPEVLIFISSWILEIVDRDDMLHSDFSLYRF